MWRKLTVSALLMLTLDVGGAVLDAPWIAEAEATCKGCDPRIKRGKLVIKKKSVGTPISLPPPQPEIGPIRPESKSWAPTQGVTITVAGATPMTAANPVRAVNVFSGSLPEGTTLADYTLDVTVRKEAASTKLAEDFKAPLELDPSGETVAGSSKILTRVRADGTLILRIRNEDRTWDPTQIESVDLVSAKGTATALTNDRIDAWFFAPLPAGFVFDKPVEVKAEVLDEDGKVTQTLTRTLTPPSDTLAPTLDRSRLSETRRGDARLATWTVTDGEPVSLEVEVTDDATGKAILDTVDTSPVRTIVTYGGEAFTFEGGEDPAGVTYLVQVESFDADGEPVGDQHEVELTMPKRVAGETVEAFVTYGGDDALGVIGVFVDDDGYTLAATSEDDSVVEVDAVFLEPFEGPAPLALEQTLGVDAVAQKWVQKGSGPLPASSTVDAALIDADGAAVDTVTVDGIGSGNVYSAGGKGNGRVRIRTSIHFDLL